MDRRAALAFTGFLIGAGGFFSAGAMFAAPAVKGVCRCYPMGRSAAWISPSMGSLSLRGTYVFYTQAYSLRGRRIEFHGSIFGVIQDVRADGCELKIESMLVDLYSGRIGRELVPQTQSK